jgi:hypothetical protein
MVRSLLNWIRKGGNTGTGESKPIASEKMDFLVSKSHLQKQDTGYWK